MYVCMYVYLDYKIHFFKYLSYVGIVSYGVTVWYGVDW